MENFEIYELTCGLGKLALAPMPGRTGDLASDVAKLRDWSADLVVSMTPTEELRQHGAADLPQILANHSIKWLSMPVTDFGSPLPEQQVLWTALSPFIHQTLTSGGNVVFHCLGGCGRSGMAALRVMVEMGHKPTEALENLRKIRPCAVETKGQLAWAST